MVKTIKARFSNGVLKPLELLDLKEGDEVTVTFSLPSRDNGTDWLDRSFGGWADLVDCEKLERDIYDSRLVSTRPKPEL